VGGVRGRGNIRSDLCKPRFNRRLVCQVERLDLKALEMFVTVQRVEVNPLHLHLNYFLSLPREWFSGQGEDGELKPITGEFAANDFIHGRNEGRSTWE